MKITMTAIIERQHARLYTAWLISKARISIHILLLHHYKSDLAHISDRYSSVIGMHLSEIRTKNN